MTPEALDPSLVWGPLIEEPANTLFGYQTFHLKKKKKKKEKKLTHHFRMTSFYFQKREGQRAKIAVNQRGRQFPTTQPTARECPAQPTVYLPYK